MNRWRLRFFIIRRIITLILSFTILVVLLDRHVFPLPDDRLHRPSATFVYSRDENLLGAYISSDYYWRRPVALKDIAPLLQKSVLACEDRWFYYHPGVNVISLISAAIDDIKAGRIVRGGSTITMQVARMMEPRRRTVMTKTIEILRSFQLELHYSKKELLEIYFNMAPYGGNIEGVGTASHFYFGKRPLELSASQAALLTSVPNSPNALRPDINAGSGIKARDRVLGVMRRRGIISEAMYREALDEEIISCKIAPSRIAPHFARDLAISNKGKSEIISTLDSRIQNISRGVAAKYKDDLSSRGISNAAIVVLENSTGEVMAMVGSLDFDDSAHQGQVNGATAPRSPGSALKPFLYAMALDGGLISPNTMLEDLPVYFAGYSPENYDRKFRGAVSAADALRLSLNVPAVSLLSQVGQPDLYRLLRTGGLSTLFRKDYEYGLPIVLGSCEVRLIDLVTLYSAFSRGGRYIPHRAELSRPAGKTEQIFSRGSSYIISEILSEVRRPDFPSSWEYSPNIPRVAWKTGTSYGRRDAWSIGYNSEYTVGVWVGNFRGEPSSYLVGADAAAPMLFEIFNAISPGNAAWFDPPSSVSTRLVCNVSGAPAGEYCPSTVEELHIPGISPMRPCGIHRGVLADSLSGIRLCRFCSEGKHPVTRVYECWPPKMATWLVKAGRVITPIPEHNPDCTGAYAGDRPVIVSPVNDVVYVIRKHVPLEEQEITLEASVAAGARNIFWFVDGDLCGRVKPGERLFYLPRAGLHKVICSDDEGRSTTITLRVE